MTAVDLTSPPALGRPAPSRPEPVPGRALMTAEEVAEMLGMRVDWVWEQSRKRRIPTVRLGRYCRYRREAIERWLAEQER